MPGDRVLAEKTLREVNHPEGEAQDGVNDLSLGDDQLCAPPSDIHEEETGRNLNAPARPEKGQASFLFPGDDAEVKPGRPVEGLSKRVVVSRLAERARPDHVDLLHSLGAGYLGEAMDRGQSPIHRFRAERPVSRESLAQPGDDLLLVEGLEALRALPLHHEKPNGICPNVNGGPSGHVSTPGNSGGP